MNQWSKLNKMTSHTCSHIVHKQQINNKFFLWDVRTSIRNVMLTFFQEMHKIFISRDSVKCTEINEISLYIILASIC